MIAIKHLWYRGHDKDKTGYSNNCLRQSAWVHQVHTWSSPSTVSAPSNVGCVTDPSQHSQNVFSHILHLIKAHSRNLAAPVASSTVYLTSLKLMHWLFFHCGFFSFLSTAAKPGTERVQVYCSNWFVCWKVVITFIFSFILCMTCFIYNVISMSATNGELTVLYLW